MKVLDLTFSEPAQNLACDEALLESGEKNGGPEILRFWSPAQTFVVLGYANAWRREVHADACRALDIPILRRSSGGGTVLQGPGCLNYSLILTISKNPQWHNIRSTNAGIMKRHRSALQKKLGRRVRTQGFTDLTLGGLKFSGNSQRRKRRCLLFHGTFLLNFDLARVEDVLAMPSQQPDYRKNRPHRHFLTNLSLPAQAVKETLKQIWNAFEPMTDVCLEKIDTLAKTRFASDKWNFKY